MMLNMRDCFSMEFLYAGEEKKIPQIIQMYESGEMDLQDVNSILELYNVKAFVETHGKKVGWGEETLEEYESVVKNVPNQIRDFFESLTAENIVPVYEQCEVVYWEDFWKLFYRFKAFERIPKENFSETIKGLHMSPERLLTCKEFVSFFDNEITQMLKEPSFGAECIVDFYMRSDKGKKLYWPAGLSPKDKYSIVLSYVNDDDVSPNTLQLILNAKSRDSSSFAPDDKLRYQAKERLEKFWRENKGVTINTSTGSVTFGPQGPEASITVSGGNIQATYNTNWIEENQDYPTLLNNFIYLFNYVDKRYRCLLTAEVLDEDIIEKVFRVSGNGMYAPGSLFVRMNWLADCQLRGYQGELKKRGIHIESIIKWFFEEYLQKEFAAEGFFCNMPKETDSILSKYNRMAAVLDGIGKQFKMFCEDGCINRGLYETSSHVPRYREIPSLIKNKYAYPNSEELEREMRDLFSDQSSLALHKNWNGKHGCLFDRLLEGRLSLKDIHEFNYKEIEWLISRGTLVLNADSLKLNYEKTWILKEFYEKKVICLQYVNSETLRKLISNGEVMSESTLLSRAEVRYFDYVLDAAFSDGLDLRNKYVHDSISSDEEKHENDYNVLLKMIVILIIKINEDFCLRDTLNKEIDFYGELIHV